MRYEKYKARSKRQNQFESIKLDEDYLKQRALYCELSKKPDVPAAAYILAREFRRVRQERGVSLQEIAVNTLITKRSLEAIEAGNLNELPGGLYVRNYFRVYAKYLGFDESVVQKAFSCSPAVTSELHRDSFSARVRPDSIDVLDDSTLPKLGEFLIYLFVPREDRVEVMGDLEEEYATVKSKFGLRAARIFFYKQVFTSISPFISETFYRALFELLDL
jgi:transcriptional regulator with XRE-family HTH domain